MKLKFNYNVPDKNTGEVYEEGQVYEFEEERAKEILAVINRDTGVPFAVEVKEEKKRGRAKKEEITEEEVQAVANAIVDEANENDKTVEDVVNESIEENKEENTDIKEDAE